MAAPATADDIRDVNVRYHDAAADHYDAKWGIQFNEVGRAQVAQKLGKLLGRPLGPFRRSLEIGAGTGYFTINLLLDGTVREAVATDISPGMLEALQGNARAAGVTVETVACDAERLPFDDGSFDLVLGHAVLHHIPDLDRAWREIFRVLAPGGTAVFAGEPSARGDRLANIPKTVALRAAPAWRRLMRAKPAAAGIAPGDDRAAPAPDGEALEPFVDVHAFTPEELARPARAAGFNGVRVRGEELLASWFGWTNRTLEASADPGSVPWLWIQYAFRGYLALQKVDRALLEGRLPPGIFYNLMIAARKPA